MSALDVHLYGVHIARVTRDTGVRVPGRLRWQWTDDAVARWGRGSRILSHGLPVGDDDRALGLRATAFVDGLLPEGDLRTSRAIDLGLDPDDTFALFSRCGVDTAGAITVTHEGLRPAPPAATTGDPLDAADLARLLRDAGAGHFEGQLTSISLAGMVPKVGVMRDPDGTFRLPAAGQASTWIVKEAHPPSSIAADVVDTEAWCLDLARRCGVTTVAAEVLDLGPTRAIAVSRYDRTPGSGRVHQEDLAQALGLATRDPERKFQHGRPMPSWEHAARILRAEGALLSPLARLLTFSFLVGNTDHHAKNTSFLRGPDGSVQMAPAYDMAAHLHHPGRHRFAFDVNGRRDADGVTSTDVLDEITSWGVDSALAAAAVQDVVGALAAALDAVDPAEHPGVPEAAHRTVVKRIERGVVALGAG